MKTQKKKTKKKALSKIGDFKYPVGADRAFIRKALKTTDQYNKKKSSLSIKSSVINKMSVAELRRILDEEE